MAKKQSRKLWISVLNVVSALAVVFLHTNGIFWSHPTGTLWYTANFIETFFYFAVPAFFMISGATLIDYRKKYDTKEFFKKRFSKTLIPFIFWSLVAWIFIALIRHETIDYNPVHVFDNILNTRYIDIYWFFIPLFALYLTIPLLTMVEDKIKIFTYCIWIGIIFVCIVPFICSALQISYNSSLTPPIMGGYIIYALAGYCLSKTELSAKMRYVIYLFGIIGWAFHFFGTIILSNGQEEINGLFKGYLNFPCFLCSMAVFVFFQYINYDAIIKTDHFSNIINKLSGLTFGVYLIHFYFVIALPSIFSINTGSMLWRGAGAILIFVGCCCITAVLKRIPLVNKIVP